MTAATRPAPDPNNWEGWVGFVFAISGALLLALNIKISGWAFLLYWVSNAVWISYGLKIQSNPLVAKEAVFALINTVAVYNWLL